MKLHVAPLPNTDVHKVRFFRYLSYFCRELIQVKLKDQRKKNILAAFVFLFTLNFVVIHFSNIDSLWNAIKCEILIVCWEPSPVPWGKGWRCRSGSVKFSLPGASIDQERTVNSGACGQMWQRLALLLSKKKKKYLSFVLIKRLTFPLLFFSLIVLI